MADLTRMAVEILKRQKADIGADSIEAMVEELDKCQHGRKAQCLIILEKNDRIRSKELMQLMGLENPNLTMHTKRLKKNLLIDIYDESRFKKPDEANYKFRYHSLTAFGRELIRDLGK